MYACASDDTILSMCRCQEIRLFSPENTSWRGILCLSGAESDCFSLQDSQSEALTLTVLPSHFDFLASQDSQSEAARKTILQGRKLCFFAVFISD